MPNDPPVITIDIEVQSKKVKKDLTDVEKQMKQFAKSQTVLASKSLDVMKEMRDLLKELVKHYKDIDSAATRAGRTQTETARKATQEQKKLNEQLERTAALTGGGGGPPGGPPGGGGGGGGGRPPSRLRRAWNYVRHPFGGGPQGGGMGIVGRTAFGLGAKALGFGLGGIQNAYGTYMQYGAARYGMTGLGTPRQLAQMRRTGRAGVSLGFSPTETAQMAPGVAAATGNLGATGVAQQLALAGGFGPGRVGEAIGYMGTMRQAGQQFTGVGNLQARQKDFSKTIALGMESGLEKARLPEFFAGVGQLVRSQFATAAGKVDANVIAKQLATLGAGGAGFQGARGAQVMGQLDAMIRRPGGGEAGQAIVLQAMGFGKPGGTTNYYDALKRQQKGVRDPENIKRVMEEVYRQRGVVEAGGADPRNREANLQFATLSGLSLEQVEQLKDIHASNMTNAEKSKKIEEIMKSAEPIDKQALNVSKEGFAGIKKHLAGVEAMQIQIGSRAAPAMMKLQNLQLKVLDHMSKYLPMIVDWLEKIFNLIMTVAAWFKKGMDPAAATREIRQKYEKITEALTKTPIQSVKALKERAAQLDISAKSERRQQELENAATVKWFAAGAAGRKMLTTGSAEATEREAARFRDIASKITTAATAAGVKPEAISPEYIQKLQRMGTSMTPGNIIAEKRIIAEAVEAAKTRRTQTAAEAAQMRENIQAGLKESEAAGEALKKEGKRLQVHIQPPPGQDARDRKVQASQKGATER